MKEVLKMVNVAINGFGRIGRMVFKIALREDSGLNVVALNDLAPVENLAYLLKYDSTYGVYDKEVDFKDNKLIVDGKELTVYSERDPSQLPWKDLNVDVVAECTGVFTEVDKAKAHLKAGAKKVLISAPCKGGGKMMVMGVNEKSYNPEEDDVASNASCTTNCAAPVMKVLNDNFKIKRSFLTTVHAVTASQGIVDAPHKKMRRGRAGFQNIVPTSTGSAKAVGEVIPELKGKMDGIAMRVPVICGSIIDVTVELEKNTSIEEVNKLFKSVSENELKGIIQYSEDELVSTDIIQNEHSAIFDSKFTNVIDGNFVKVTAWYDNEWGFSRRMVDMLHMIGSKL